MRRLVRQARALSIPVFLKEDLLPILGEEQMVQEQFTANAPVRYKVSGLLCLCAAKRKIGAFYGAFGKVKPFAGSLIMPQAKELPACPVETTLMLIGDKWKVLILRDLLPGTKRFGELKKSIGSVSQKVLTAQLRDMEAKGLVSRRVYAEVPPRVEYSLTNLGKSLKPILDAMQTWGESYQAQNS